MILDLRKPRQLRFFLLFKGVFLSHFLSLSFSLIPFLLVHIFQTIYHIGSLFVSSPFSVTCFEKVCEDSASVKGRREEKGGWGREIRGVEGSGCRWRSDGIWIWGSWRKVGGRESWLVEGERKEKEGRELVLRNRLKEKRRERVSGCGEV